MLQSKFGFSYAYAFSAHSVVKRKDIVIYTGKIGSAFLTIGTGENIAGLFIVEITYYT